jgi:hypothetical protein
VNVAEAAMEASGQDYNIYVPIQNALGREGGEHTGARPQATVNMRPL